MKIITPCCGGRKCPKLIVYKGNKIEIEDDFKGKISMTKEQAVHIAKAILDEIK